MDGREPPWFLPDRSWPLAVKSWVTRIPAARRRPRPTGTLVLTSEARADFTSLALPLIRSWRYQAVFDCTGAAEGCMTDTPVLESVWLSFRQKGRAGTWTRREVR